MKHFDKIVVMLLTAAAGAAQPVIGTGGVLNGASNALQGLPSSAIAQGSIFVVYGTGLGPPPPLYQYVTYGPGFPLQTAIPTANGTSINVSVNGKTVPALMVYTSPFQIAAILQSTVRPAQGRSRSASMARRANRRRLPWSRIRLAFSPRTSRAAVRQWFRTSCL